MSDYVVLQQAGTHCAVAAEQVLEVVEMPWPSRWPAAGGPAVGMVDYRGGLLPVLDLQRCLGGSASPLQASSQLLVLETRSQRRLGLMVEQVSDLRSLADQSPQPLAECGWLRPLACAPAFVTLEGRVTLLLDPEALADRTAETGEAVPPACSPELEPLLRQRAEELALPPPPPVPRDLAQVVVVRLGQENFALDVQEVAALIPRSAVTTMPGAPPHLLGLLYHRGALMRLVDVRAQLGLPAAGLPAEVVVLTGSGVLTGIAVDAVVTVTTLPARSQPGPAPSSLLFEGGWLTLLDLSRLVVRVLAPDPRGEREGGLLPSGPRE